MAIDDRSLETRLGEIVPQQLSLPDPLLANVDTSMPVDAEFAADESMEPVEVAGLGLIKGLLKSKSAAAAKGVAKGSALADEAANLGGKVAAEVAEPAKVVTQPVRKKPGKRPVQEQVTQAQQQLKAVEANIEQTPAAGTTEVNVVNLNRIEGPDDFKQMVESLNRSAGIGTQKLSWEQTIADAKAKGFGSDLIADLEQMQKMYQELPSDIVRLRIASYQNNREIFDLMKQAYLNPDDDEMLAKVLFKINAGNVINETYKLASTRAAQATATGRITITPNVAEDIAFDVATKVPAYDSAEMKAMLNTEGVRPELKKLMEAYLQLTDEGAQLELINKVGKGGLTREIWDRTWKAGLLSGTGTHVVNAASNVTFLASSLATRQLAGVAGAARRAAGMGGEVELGEAAAMLAGMVNTWRDAMRLGWTALKTGTTREMREGSDLLSDAGMKYETNNMIFDARQYGLENETAIKAANGWANFVTLLGTRPIMATDEVFKSLGYQAELHAQAYRKGAQARREAITAGKSAEEAEQAGLEAMGKTMSDPGNDVQAAAEDFSHMITFSRKLTGSAAALQELTNEHLLARIAMPFVKTPVWVTSESMQHSPMAFLSSQWKKDIKAGGAKAELAMAKFGMGTSLMLGVGSFVADGRITGGGPGDTAMRNEYLASGWRPYSFVFKKGEWDDDFVQYLKSNNIDPSIGAGDNLYVPFRGIDPIAGPMAMISDAVEYARYEDDQDKVGQVILGAAWGLYNYVSQMPVMTAISSVAGAFSQTVPNPKAAFRAAIDATVKQATGYALEGSPVGIFSSARGQAARAIDPYKRDVSADPNLDTGLKGWQEAFNYYKSRTPGLSEELPFSYDYLGEKELRGDLENPWLSSSIGVRYSSTKQREADKIIIATETKLEKPRRNLTVDKVNVKLTPEEYSYMMSSLGTQKIPHYDPKDKTVKNMTVKDAIVAEALMDEFKQLDKDQQQNTIKKLYSKYVEMAKADLLATKPSVMIRAEKAKARLPIYGNP
jgi:hypothetical protein